MIGALLEALTILFSWPVFGWLVFAIVVGLILGAIPGIGPTLAMALILPFTIFLSGIEAFVILIGIFHGAVYGGSLSAILINVPGTAASAASTFDGYSMTRKGLAKNALAISATASAIGGILTVIVLLAISPVITEMLLRFGSPENFLMAILGITMISVITRGAILKGYIAGFFGLLLTTIGMAPNLPEQRHTYGYLELFDGLDFIAILIGVFAISEILILSKKSGSISDSAIGVTGSVRDGISSVIKRPFLNVKSAMIGLVIGAIPGAGASISNFFAYSEAMRKSKTPDEFGGGSKEGLVAAEGANSGTIAGSIVPTIAFGIPGSTSTAVLLGGLILHGLRPGPSLFSSDLHITYTMFLTVFIGSLLIFILGVTVVIRGAYITQVDSAKLIPLIVVLSVLGGYAIRLNIVDVLTVVLIGFVGYFMVKYNYSVIAFTLGAVLGRIAEVNLYRSLTLPDGAWAFVTRPISLLLLICIVVMLMTPLLQKRASA